MMKEASGELLLALFGEMRDTLVVLRKFHLFSVIDTLRLQDRKTFQTKKDLALSVEFRSRPLRSVS